MNEINRLWDKWVKDHEDEDVDQIIAYFRKQLAMYDQGIKPKRVEAEQVDINKILQKIKQQPVNPKQTKLPPIPKPKSGLRRI